MFPEKFGRYEIRQELGHGGMARVYLAWDPVFEREVAIKMLPREVSDDSQFRERFEREAKIVARLEHPAIVPVYDFGESQGLLYLVMRYMPGGSLKDRLDSGKFTLSDAAAMVSRIAPALDLAHSRGIVHRDIKPGNILFDSAGEAYLSDFGIAKVTLSANTLTGNFVLGTPAYMSPEQARGESNIDGRSDIYSLGAMLFEMLSGRVPYEAETPSGQLIRHITDPVPNILDVRRDLPAPCQEIIGRSMAKTPGDRYPTVKALSSHLNKIASMFPDTALRTTVVSAAGKTPAGNPPQARRLPPAPVLFMLALVPLVLVLFGGTVLALKLLSARATSTPTRAATRPAATGETAAPAQPSGTAEIFFHESGLLHYSLEDGGEAQAAPGQKFPARPGARLWAGDRAAWVFLKDGQGKESARIGLGPGGSIILTSIGGNGSALSLELQTGALLADSAYLIVETQAGGYKASGKTALMGMSFDPAADEFTVDCIRGSCLAGSSDQPSLSLSEGDRQRYQWGNRLELASVQLADWAALGVALALPTVTASPTENPAPSETASLPAPTQTTNITAAPTPTFTATRPPFVQPTSKPPPQPKKKTSTPAPP